MQRAIKSKSKVGGGGYDFGWQPSGGAFGCGGVEKRQKFRLQSRHVHGFYDGRWCSRLNFPTDGILAQACTAAIVAGDGPHGFRMH